MQDIIDSLNKVNMFATEAMLLDLINRIAANRSNPELRKHFRSLLANERQDNQCAINVLAAGMFAICLGGKYMLASDDGGYKVHPFLHNLRKAMLDSAPLRDQLSVNSKKYIFFTEFYESLSNKRSRIAAIAKAHAGADLGSDLLTVLYSLGGTFSKSETDTGLRDAKRAGGTTCIMTARAVYHAAGMQMIGNRKPSVGTPGGPQLELGVPMQRQANSGKLLTEASIMRADQIDFGLRGFNDDNESEANRPQFEMGDIYYIDGDGDFKFLLRNNGSLAAHVGIIVDAKGGRIVDTIDGGSGTGAKVDLNLNREVKFTKLLGWTIDKPGKSFTTTNINDVEAYMAGFVSNEAVMNWLRQNALAGKALLKAIEKNERDLAMLANQPLLVKQLEKAHAGLFDAARKLIREVKKGEKTLGQDRVIKGWWKPNNYSELDYCGRETLSSWLS